MLTKKKNVIQYSWLIFAVFFAFSLCLLFSSSVLSNDDLYYMNDLKRYSFITWCRKFYLNWGGRVPLQLTDNLFLLLPQYVWKIFIAFIYTLIPLYCRIIASSFFKEKKFFVFFTVLSCSLMLFLPNTLLKYGLLSASGAFNYPFPCAMFLIGILPFVLAITDNEISLFYMISGYIGIFFCCYSEQNAAVFLILATGSVVYIWYRKRIYLKKLLPLLLWGYFHSAIMFSAPGNHKRMLSETMLWNSSFDMIHFDDKLLLGFIHYMSYTYRNGFYLFVIILICLAYLIWYKGTFYRVMISIHIAISPLVFFLSGKISDSLFTDIYNDKKLAAVFGMILWIILFIWFIASMVPDFKIGCSVALLTAGSVVSGTVIGLSPSIYASTERIFFLSFILLILSAVILSGTTLKEHFYRSDGKYT